MAILAIILISEAAFGQNASLGPGLNYGLGFRVEHHENIAQLPGEEISDQILAPFLDFGLNRQGPVLDATVVGFAEYANYSSDTFDNEFRGTLSADVLWKISENRFHWVLQENLARSPINILSRNTPDNIQQTNVITTGPDFLFRLGSASQLDVGLRYTDFQAETTDSIDSSSVSLNAQWQRRLSAQRQYGVSVQNEKFDFGQAAGFRSDYDQSQFNIFYDTQRTSGGSQKTFSAQIGYSEVSFDSPGIEDIDSPTIQLSWSRSSPEAGSLNITAQRSIGSIVGDIGSIEIAQGPSVIQQTAVVRDPFTRNSISLGWQKSWQRTQLSIQSIFDQQDYDTNELDQDQTQLFVSANYRLRPLLTLDATLSVLQQDFDAALQDDSQLGLSVGLSYRRTRSMTYSLILGHNDRDSSNPNLDFDDTFLIAQVVYRQ